MGSHIRIRWDSCPSKGIDFSTIRVPMPFPIHYENRSINPNGIASYSPGLEQPWVSVIFTRTPTPRGLCHHMICHPINRAWIGPWGDTTQLLQGCRYGSYCTEGSTNPGLDDAAPSGPFGSPEPRNPEFADSAHGSRILV